MLELGPLDPRIQPKNGDGCAFLFRSPHLKPIHPDYNLLSGFNFALVRKRGILDLRADVTVLDGCHGASHGVDVMDILERFGFDAIGEGFDILAASDRVD